MNPDTLQPNQGAVQTQTQPQLDPSVVALTKAIGKAESGGKYQAPSGDPGSAPSAYQFTPGFIDKWAPQILPNYQQGNYNLTPAQQDELAYGAVKTMGTTGDSAYQHLGKLSPAQIASAWNTGDPNAYLDPEYGKNNAYGSTQKYVEQVQQNYEKLNPQAQSQTPNPLGMNVANASRGKPQSSGPNLLDWILGGTAVGGGFLASHFGKIAKQSLPEIGAVAGSALGPMGTAGGAAIGTGIASLIPGETPQTPPTQTGGTPTQQPDVIQELATLEADMPQANQASKRLFDTQSQALQTTIGGRNMINDPQMQGGMEANAKYGFAPEIDQTGSMNWQPALQKSQKAVANLSEGIKEALNAEGAVAPMQVAVSHAKKELRRTTPSVDWAEGDKEIDKAAQSYSKNFGDGKGGMALGHFQQMKQELGHGKKWGILESTAKKRAYKALSAGARRTIEEHTQHKELYNRTMKEEQKLINGQAIMRRLNGKKAPKNEGLIKHLLHSGGRYASLYIGDKIGGPMGAILGSMVGDYITGRIDKKYGKTIFETPAMYKALEHLNKDHPASYKILVEQLEKAGVIPPNKGTATPKQLKKIDAKVPNLKKFLEQQKLPKGFKGRVTEDQNPVGLNRVLSSKTKTNPKQLQVKQETKKSPLKFRK